MAEIKKRKTRMYDPWGYQEENNYQSSETQFEIDLNELFASAMYNGLDKKIHFFNNDGKELSGSTIDTTQFSPSVIEEAYYDPTTKELVIVFGNGDTVRINMAELIDENEFGDGLQVDSGGVVSVKIDEASDPYLTVGVDGIKIFGIKDAIEAEIARAISAETTLDEKIDQEIADRIADVDAEETRAISAETALDNKIDQEIANRIADVDAEESRAISAETALQEALNAEITRSTREDNIHDDELRILDARVDLLDSKLNTEISRATSAETALDAKITALKGELEEEIERSVAKDEELEGNDVASGYIGSDATISITRNNGDTITFSSAEEIELGAGEF